MEHTDRQRAEFKEAYAKRLRKKIIMLVPTLAATSALAITSERATIFGLPAAVAGPISFVVIAVGWWILESRNWRCPACNEYLGRAFNPTRCRGCGIELRKAKSDAVR